MFQAQADIVDGAWLFESSGGMQPEPKSRDDELYPGWYVSAQKCKDRSARPNVSLLVQAMGSAGLLVSGVVAAGQLADFPGSLD